MYCSAPAHMHYLRMCRNALDHVYQGTSGTAVARTGNLSKAACLRHVSQLHRTGTGGTCSMAMYAERLMPVLMLTDHVLFRQGTISGMQKSRAVDSYETCNDRSTNIFGCMPRGHDARSCRPI